MAKKPQKQIKPQRGVTFSFRALKAANADPNDPNSWVSWKEDEEMPACAREALNEQIWGPILRVLAKHGLSLLDFSGELWVNMLLITAERGLQGLDDVFKPTPPATKDRWVLELWEAWSKIPKK